MFRSSLAALALLMLDQHGSSASASPTPPTGGIDWYACTQNASIATTCGTLDVPLDYTATTSNESLTLHLVKINATTQPSRGSIIFDFGGPGNINVDNFAGSNGEGLLLMTGGTYDLVTFEPRGTGITLPYSCYNSSEAGAAAIAYMPQALGTPEGAIEKAWSVAGAQADACYRNAADIGRLVGTSFVARDIMQIVDGLGEDGLLRYYGFSYGTALGATVAAMFPDRIDKLLLDGVVNPTEYWNSPSYSFSLDTDITLSVFFTGCIESPELCALAPIFNSAGAISRRFASLVKALEASHLDLGSDNMTDAVTYGMVKSTIVSALYFPFTWSSVAELLAAVVEGNASALASATVPSYSPPSLFPNLAGPEVQNGIQCADKPFRSDNLADMLPVLARFEAQSWIRGDGDIAIQALQCARWRFTSKERYKGTFENIKTRYPALIVGNSIDPTTPLASARNLSEGLKGSVLLQNNGYGHTTIASPSLCTVKHVRAYFVDGTLPPAGTICESVTSIQPFAFDGSYYDVIQPLASNASNVKRSVDGSVDSDDVALFDAVREFGKGFARSKLGMRAV